jgi:23S rRNA pseudouridine1911/1915/1917 synthase
MSEVLRFEVKKIYESMKLISVLKNEVHLSSRWIKKLKQEKKVFVNGYNISMNANLRVGDHIEIHMPNEDNIFEPENIPLEILYEDAHFIVVNKQPYIVVHPTKGHPSHTLANGVAYYMLKKKENYKIRFGHRLDRDTSGALIICKNAHSQKWIHDQMLEGSIYKSYVAIVKGALKENKARIDLPILEPSGDDILRKVDSKGLKCVTRYEVLEQLKGHTWVKIILETGRTHQIRVHMAHMGHPVLGDSLYGKEDDYLNRQALHAKFLEFKNLEGEIVSINAPLHEDIKNRLEELR